MYTYTQAKGLLSRNYRRVKEYVASKEETQSDTTTTTPQEGNFKRNEFSGHGFSLELCLPHAHHYYQQLGQYPYVVTHGKNLI